MKVEIDSGSGFCFGVENAVAIAEKALEAGEKVYCLGSIVHNDAEVKRLTGKGLITIDREEFRKLNDCKVLIRAHGEPPTTYEIAERNNITIIEATCPIVKRLQARIRRAWNEAREDDGQVVIFGKEGHAEVIGLLGQTNNEAILINSEADVDRIDFTKKIYLFSQTTLSVKEYEHLVLIIRQRITEEGIAEDPEELLKVNHTICGQVSNREPRLRSFCALHDVIIFVSGRESSNGKMLFNVCRNKNQNAYMISSPEELRTEWFRGNERVGVCGATSTPKWLIERVAARIEKIGERLK
ncbi:MAG: 4-hydroxy-3-methylbut-2-enyl diphosphate reductase [Bacteroidales bacterium]